MSLSAKNLFLSLSFFILATLSLAQPKDQNTSWKFSFSKENIHKGDIVDLTVDLTINEGYYVYSMYYDCGPLPTEITFQENADYELIGKLQVIGDKKKYSDLFECEYNYFEKKGKYIQKVKVLQDNPSPLTGKYNYQVCNDANCIPYFDVKFSVAFKANSAPKKIDTPQKVTTEEITPKPILKDDIIKSEPQKTTVEEKNKIFKDAPKAIIDIQPAPCTRKAGIDDIEVVRYSTNTNAENTTSFKDLLLFAAISFIAGLLALLTPCVFPMIPMTVSFFTNSTKSRAAAIKKGITYGVFIIVIYTLLGTIVASLFGPSFANAIATNWIINLLFFIIFILFGLSFLGLFEITLPNKFINNIDQKSDKGGLVGMFFMAFTLVLVSFSCTGPVVGSILISAAGGELLKPIVGMLGYSAAFAIPFALFAIFPSAINKLPQSGSWLNSVKVVLGLLELALAFKFLSVADQAYHWNLLSRNTFLIIWIVIFTIMFLYLVRNIFLIRNGEAKKIGFFRPFFVIIVLVFTIYLISGLTGKALPLLSGILPPKAAVTTNTHNARYADRLHLPHGLEGYFDLREAICASQKEDKPIFIDATGHGCVNCRQMEVSVWSKPQVLSLLKEDFIILALYADDRVIELPQEEQYIKKDGTKVSMMRQLNNHFLQEKFQIHAQPYYLILEPKTTGEGILLKEISTPHKFDLDEEHFINFLTTGLENFGK